MPPSAHCKLTSLPSTKTTPGQQQRSVKVSIVTSCVTKWGQQVVLDCSAALATHALRWGLLTFLTPCRATHQNLHQADGAEDRRNEKVCSVGLCGCIYINVSGWIERSLSKSDSPCCPHKLCFGSLHRAVAAAVHKLSSLQINLN